MNIKLSSGLLAILVSLFFTLSCTKKKEDPAPNPNQPLSDQIFSWGDSITKKILIDSINMPVQGAIIYVNDPSKGFEFLQAFGTSDVATPRFLPLKTTDLFRIGNITNSFTTTILLQMIQDSVLVLETQLSNFFPAIPNSQNITLRQMANNTSGLYDFMDTDSIRRNLAEHPLRVYSPQQLVNFAMAYPPYFEPGAGFHYSNTNSVLLGMIIEKVTSDILSENYRKRVLEPLRMSGTIFPINEFMPFYTAYSHGYLYTDTLPTLTDVTERYNPSWAWGSANLISSLSELLIWLPSLVNGTLIKPAIHQEQMMMVDWENYHGIPLQYGLGIMGANGYYGHIGDYKGYRNIMMQSPSNGNTIIILTNNGSSDPLLLFGKIANLLNPGLFQLTTNGGSKRMTNVHE